MENGRGLKTNRIELIHIITDLIEASGTRLIEEREDSRLLAIHIVDGLEDEARRVDIAFAVEWTRRFREAASSDKGAGDGEAREEIEDVKGQEKRDP